MSKLPYPIHSNDIIKCQIMESKSNFYHIKNDKNNWDLIQNIIKTYSISHKKTGCFLSDCLGTTYDIEDIYNNMIALMLVFNSNHSLNQSNKKRKISQSNNENDNQKHNETRNILPNVFGSYRELPDLMFRKKHAQHFLQNFKLPLKEENQEWPFTIYFFSGNNVYYADGYNGKNCGEFIFNKTGNNQPIIFTNFINQLC